MRKEISVEGATRATRAADASSRLGSERSANRAAADLIQSRDNKWLKAFRAALRSNGPEPREPIGIEGPKLVEEAVRAGLDVQALLVSETGERELEPILRAASESEGGISRSRILRTTDKLFTGAAGTETPQGVAALVRQPEWNFEDLLCGAALPDGSRTTAEPLVVLLAGVQDPGNVGTILRSAEAFGATGVIAARGTADPWSPKSIRASAGSALRLPILRGIAGPIVIAQLRMARVRLFAASAQSRRDEKAHDDSAASTRRQNDFRGPCAICIGSEGHGLAAEVETAADARISVPMIEAVESLNAAVAASVLLYEAARQRRSEGKAV